MLPLPHGHVVEEAGHAAGKAHGRAVAVVLAVFGRVLGMVGVDALDDGGLCLSAFGEEPRGQGVQAGGGVGTGFGGGEAVEIVLGDVFQLNHGLLGKEGTCLCGASPVI